MAMQITRHISPALLRQSYACQPPNPKNGSNSSSSSSKTEMRQQQQQQSQPTTTRNVFTAAAGQPPKWIVSGQGCHLLFIWENFEVVFNW